MTLRVGVPSRGRLRDDVMALLGDAGLGAAPSAPMEGVELIEMRPRDAAAWFDAGRLEAAFISTDIVMEHGLTEFPAMALGLSPSTLVAAVRDEDSRSTAGDLTGATIATHLPNATSAWLAASEVRAEVVTMGGALEGVCAAGLADAIVDLRQTGQSLARNGLRVLAQIAECEAVLVHRPGAGLEELVTRIGAVLAARAQRYVMLHIDPGQVDELAEIFGGLASPTVLPLAGRSDLVAVHLVVSGAEFWAGLGRIRALGASGIVALRPDALLA